MYRNLMPRRAALVAVATALLAAACGGGDTWDEFRPRAATVSDIASRSFRFTDFSYGAVFDASLANTTTTLAFGSASAAGSGHVLPFSLAASGASVAGAATLEADRLTLVVAQAAPGLPFTSGQQLVFTLEADVDDGRIRLTNRSSGVQAASAP
jgi:hypothetical protein